MGGSLGRQSHHFKSAVLDFATKPVTKIAATMGRGLTVVVDLCIGITPGGLGLEARVAAKRKRQEEAGAGPSAKAAARRRK